MHRNFIAFANTKGISLEHADDLMNWYDCWINGFNTASLVYSKKLHKYIKEQEIELQREVD